MASRLRKKANGWGARVRFGEKLSRDEWIHLDIPHDQESLARDRLARLQVMAKRLDVLGRHTEARTFLEEAGATLAERGFREIEQMVEELSPGGPAERKKPTTFREVAQDLCDGTLHDLYPDEIRYRTKEGRDHRRAQLATFFPVLGDKTFDQITRDDIDEAKKLVPQVKINTRIRYLRELRYLLNLAVEPLRLCEHVPVVKVPKQVDTDLFQLIYPDEEERVAGCELVPFEERFLYAYLVRNGGRISETLQITWDHIDLERGKIRIAKAWTKTKRARFWDLEPDVLEALRLRRRQIPDATLVFVPPPGRVFSRMKVYHRLHANLRAAGLDRPELFTAPEGERPITTHDFRASFVTLARAVGMHDRWIRDRSGHESAKVLEQYDRGVRHAREQGLGWWAPMAIALRMPGAKEPSRLGPREVQTWAKLAKTSSEPQVLSNRCDLDHGPTEPFNTENSSAHLPSIPQTVPLGPAEISISGQRPQLLAVPDEVSRPALGAEHLTRLHDLAARAKQWDLVALLAVALDAVSKAEAPNVSSLDAARRRREEGK